MYEVYKMARRYKSIHFNQPLHFIGASGAFITYIYIFWRFDVSLLLQILPVNCWVGTPWYFPMRLHMYYTMRYKLYWSHDGEFNPYSRSRVSGKSERSRKRIKSLMISKDFVGCHFDQTSWVRLWRVWFLNMILENIMIWCILSNLISFDDSDTAGRKRDCDSQY